MTQGAGLGRGLKKLALAPGLVAQRMRCVPRLDVGCLPIPTTEPMKRDFIQWQSLRVCFEQINSLTST